jgi:ADP-heptose:LPS heptosyltransferase
MRKLILKNWQSPGDILMLTAAVRDLHRSHPGMFMTDVRTPFPDLWLHNPYLTSLDEEDADTESLDVEYPIIGRSDDGVYHFVHAFSLDLEEKLGMRIAVSEAKGDLHLSDEEMSGKGLVAETLGRHVDYWLICTGGKADYTAKWWIPEYAQEVVEHFRGRIQFVQFGEAGPNHYHPPLRGVVDLRGKTTVRDLILLVYHAVGVVCPVTFAMHLAAAVPGRPGLPGGRPCVVVAGGREPGPFTFYKNHQYLHTIGALPCCMEGGCWRSRIEPIGDGDPKDGEVCTDRVEYRGRWVQRCMHDLVTPGDVVRAIEKYYIGGALEFVGDRDVEE